MIRKLDCRIWVDYPCGKFLENLIQPVSFLYPNIFNFCAMCFKTCIQANCKQKIVRFLNTVLIMDVVKCFQHKGTQMAKKKKKKRFPDTLSSCALIQLQLIGSLVIAKNEKIKRAIQNSNSHMDATIVYLYYSCWITMNHWQGNQDLQTEHPLETMLGNLIGMSHNSVEQQETSWIIIKTIFSF